MILFRAIVEPGNENNLYFKILTKLLQKIIDKGIEGKIYLNIDNAPNHSPKLLPNRIKQRFGDKVNLIFIPCYAPNPNPIEQVWKYLLKTTERCGDNKEELRIYFNEAISIYKKNIAERELTLSCRICSKKWIFTEEKKE